MRSDYDNFSLVVGRFQPLHKGHMDVIRKCAEESEHLTIGIGSAQYSHTPENPFTAGERYMMINKTLRDEGIDNYSIVPIEDLNRYPVWVSHVVSLVPPFKRVYSNNPLTRRLFQEAGFEVRASPLYNREIFSGTEIRRRIVNNEEWRSLVPSPVADVIDAIDGVERLKQISSGVENAPL
ncbi:MAG: nicotinamide-nucleotide adenylyltransferase [Candidatus Methanomethylophilaceae archaeon]|nr:nicotinamide-nucleotide adenylyltransferase [Candidatus Methanomethylophilaceae archaeon]MBR1452645.1 nicotinamide-nucleotide adenylyltransferase [Candidatus Methanomethylophilaceae archaeon]MBR4202913.1 nicotinamide-nucleotide adenylyltransferase [Candidatus Methanomethylophilaceae archaeon]